MILIARRAPLGPIYIGATTDVDSLLMRLVDIVGCRVTRIAFLDGGEAEAEALRKQWSHHKIIDGWFRPEGGLVEWAYLKDRERQGELLLMGEVLGMCLSYLAEQEEVSVAEYFKKNIEPIITEKYQAAWDKSHQATNTPAT